MRAVVPTRPSRVVVFGALYLVFAGAHALQTRVASYEAYQIDGPSMDPTIRNGDRVLVEKSAYGLTLPLEDEARVHWADPAVGDVVVIRSPYDGLDIVKRVVGVAGDRIGVRGGVVQRNDAPVAHRVVECPSDLSQRADRQCVEESMGERSWMITMQPPDDEAWFDDGDSITVPDGMVYVLGDHRDASNDSRRLGPIPVERVRGRASAIYWGQGSGRVGWVR